MYYLKIFLLVLVVFCVPILSSTIEFVNAFLYENGTCTDEKVKETAKQVINTNGTVDDFLKSLPSDNTILAEIVC
jgi:hypothetical protein